MKTKTLDFKNNKSNFIELFWSIRQHKWNSVWDRGLCYKYLETIQSHILTKKLKIIKNNEKELIISYEKNIINIQEIIDIIKRQKIHISDVQSTDPDLEDVFIKLTKN